MGFISPPRTFFKKMVVRIRTNCAAPLLAPIPLRIPVLVYATIIILSVRCSMAGFQCYYFTVFLLLVRLVLPVTILPTRLLHLSVLRNQQMPRISACVYHACG